MIITINSDKPSNPKDGDSFYDKINNNFYIYHYNKWWLFATKNTLDIIIERKQKINKLLSKINNIN